MLEGAATARLRENSTAIIPGITSISVFIVIPPYCSARSRYPFSLDIAIAVPPCHYLAWLKPTTIHQLGTIRRQALSSDCFCLSDRFVRSVHESHRLTEWSTLR